jgi:hypothetical protein
MWQHSCYFIQNPHIPFFQVPGSIAAVESVLDSAEFESWKETLFLPHNTPSMFKYYYLNAINPLPPKNPSQE